MTIITAGVTSPANLVARQEIRTFAQDPELMELYLLGLERFQKVDQTDPLSWFQIAGIHGRPYIAYDGAAGVGNLGGYCTHSSILFPPWHRPYLALFEQTLAKHVADIANEYQGDQKQKYVNAAQRFRTPYWDWAANADLPGFISTQSQVTVNSPTGQRTLPNPLFSYTFHPLYSNFGDGLPDEATWESWQSTLRWPTARNASGHSNPTALESNLQNNRLTIRDRTYNLLSQATTYEAFSNDGYLGPRTDPKFFDSLESIHNSIHGLTGSSGHMGYVDYAAFDPVFWLHHCNVDRLLTIWQALNPKAWVVPRANPAGTFTEPRGTVENEQSPLTPFWKENGVFWTSATARDTRTFNYTYPELAKWASLTPEEKSARLRTDVNTLYGKSAPFAALSPELFQPAAAAAVAKPAQKVVQAVPASVSAAAVKAANIATATAQKVASAVPASASNVASSAASTATGAATTAAHGIAAIVPASVSVAASKSAEFTDFSAAGGSTVQDHKHYLEWIANITVEKYATKSSFFVYIFLGDFNPDPTKWGEDPNLVGTHVIFANNMDFTGCERCRDAAEQHKLVTGTIPLTGAIGDRLGIDRLLSLGPDQIVPYLQRELHWRIQKSDGTVVERADIPSLKVAVAHFTVQIPDTITQFPTWGEGRRDGNVTVGRPGGAGEDD
ncbi:Di-copper centre-containing protein [Serendipita vermifera]|nr:Di-copper centre-containing protein [Serendipita vermifera]